MSMCRRILLELVKSRASGAKEVHFTLRRVFQPSHALNYGGLLLSPLVVPTLYEHPDRLQHPFTRDGPATDR